MPIESLWQFWRFRFASSALSVISVSLSVTWVMPTLVMWSWLLNLDHLAPFSAIANVFTAVSVAIIFSYLVPNLQNPVEENFPKVQNFEKFALFFGTAIFSFEGISVVLPLENNAAEPEDFPKVRTFSCVLRVVETQAVLFFKSMSERGGSAIRFSNWISWSTQNWLKMTSFNQFSVNQEFQFQNRCMADPPLSDIDFKNCFSLNYPYFLIRYWILVWFW